jgi:hypothetical protein
MAKKKIIRRVPQSASPRMYGDGKPSQAAQAATGKSPAATRATSGGTGGAASARGAANLAQEYSYVLGDLKRLGIIAGALFAVLVILGVVIR